MFHIDLHDDRTSETVRVGTLEEFADLFIKETGSVTLVFSDRKHQKRAKESLVRIFQRKWNERKAA